MKLGSDRESKYKYRRRGNGDKVINIDTGARSGYSSILPHIRRRAHWILSMDKSR
jgi:hypothetical protein